MKRDNLRNIAIIAHVDHGKTTLVDAMFKQSGIYRDNQEVVDRVMDAGDQERERGITIMAKTTSVDFDGMRIQIVDTPGHADFGGEVERTLNMVDGALLLVDAAEGPLPQTRFVLRKALALNLAMIVVINKIDRSDARPQEVLNEIYDLFIDLGASEEQIAFPVLYAITRDGVASHEPVPGENLQPLVKAIKETVPAPEDRSDQPFSMRVNQLSYDDFVGRLLVGRIHSGKIKANENVVLCTENGDKNGRITGVFTFHGTKRTTLKEAQCGDIIALGGIENASIGDTVRAPDSTESLDRIRVDEPTVSMVFQINDGPFSGRSGGKHLTSRELGSRLQKEAYANVSIRVEPGESTDQFRVMGRGELQLAVLIETLRREKFELCVRSPQAVTRDGENGPEEPVEQLVIDVPAEYIGGLSQLLGTRQGRMIAQQQEGSRVRLEYRIPTRGLFGIRNSLLSLSRGTAIAANVFDSFEPVGKPFDRRTNGALVADREGVTTPYALFHLQPRGRLFVGPGVKVYEGMIVGEHNRSNDLNVNVVREKKLTNVRASGKDDATILEPPVDMSLERCLEWIGDDEMVEVTPEIIRLRKSILKANKRQ